MWDGDKVVLLIDVYPTYLGSEPTVWDGDLYQPSPSFSSTQRSEPTVWDGDWFRVINIRGRVAIGF